MTSWSQPSADSATIFDTPGHLQATQHYSTAILGPCVLGWAGQLMLYGMVVAWTSDYVKSDLYRRDPPRRRVMLFSVVGLSTMQAAFNLYLLWFWTTSQARAAEDLIRPTYPDALQPLSSLTMAPIVQSFLAKRAIKLLHAPWAKWLSTVFFGVIIVCEFIAALYNVIISILFHQGQLEGALLKAAQFNSITGAWLWCAAICDVGVTVLLCVVLHKRIAGFNSQTDTLLQKLSKLAIQSASYTAVLAVLGAILAYAVPNDNLTYSSIPYPFWYLLPSCYPIALLTALSSRAIFAQSASSANETNKVTNALSGAPHTAAGGLDFASPRTAAFSPGGDRRSRFFDTVGLGLSSKQHRRQNSSSSPAGRLRPADGITVEKRTTICFDSDDDDDPISPVPYRMRVGLPQPQPETPDLERGREEEEEYGMKEITGKSTRKEVWE
ncbi:hypothetical protein JCM8547_002954 [Rhodosporidiobolus lusitaniae]